MWNLLLNKNFFSFWCAQVISQLGDGIARIAIIYLVSTLSNDPLAIGFVIFAQLLPTAVFGIFFGPIADKFSRKWLMINADLYRMIISIIMIFFHDSVAILLVLIVFQGLGTAIFDPARSAIIPDLIGKSNIQQAISLSQGTRAAMDIVGPTIGGFLLLLNNYSTIFLIDAMTFLLSGVLLLRLAVAQPKPTKSTEQEENYFASIVSGVKQVIGMPALRFLLLLLIPVTFVMGALNTNLPAVLTHVFNVSPAHFGMLEATVGVGAIVGALIVGPFLLKLLRPSTLLLIGTSVIGAWMVVIIPIQSMLSLTGITSIYVWCLMIGVLNTLINVPLSSLFLGATPAYFRGRGQSLLGVTANSFQMIGILVGGILASKFGTLNGTAISGIMLIVVVIFFPLLTGFKELHNIQLKKSESSQKSNLNEKTGESLEVT